jgi:hypothetical protein
MPPCSGQSRPSPAGGREDAASLDRPCARRLRQLAVGMEEYSRRGSNQRMRPKRARKPTISNRWFSRNFRLALTMPDASCTKPIWTLSPPPGRSRSHSGKVEPSVVACLGQSAFGARRRPCRSSVTTSPISIATGSLAIGTPGFWVMQATTWCAAHRCSQRVRRRDNRRLALERQPVHHYACLDPGRESSAPSSPRSP